MITEWEQRELLFDRYTEQHNPDGMSGYSRFFNVNMIKVKPELSGAGPTFTVQYTGKKDVNEKKIFEGDIVNFLYIMTLPLPNSELEHIDYWYDGVIVMNKDNIWCIKRVGHNYYPLHEQDSDKIEITGNYFQNPELVEKYDLEILVKKP